MRYVILLLVALAGCSSSQTPTAPSGVTLTPVAVTSPSAAPVVALPPVAAAPPVIPPPVNADPPPTPGRAFVRTDCDYSTLSAIRCYNPSDSPLTITAALNTPDCGTSYGAQTVTIAPRTNGYFTLPSLACGQTAQIDAYFGSQQGSCRAPDFTSQRTYSGPACPTPPPTPPPVCVEPAWGPWTSAPVTGSPATCRRERRERARCDGTVEVEFREVCQ